MKSVKFGIRGDEVILEGSEKSLNTEVITKIATLLGADSVEEETCPECDTEDSGDSEDSMGTKDKSGPPHGMRGMDMPMPIVIGIKGKMKNMACGTVRR
jgi:hypothetical protein